MISDRLRGSGHRLKHRRLTLNIRKRFLLWEWLSAFTGSSVWACLSPWARGSSEVPVSFSLLWCTDEVRWLMTCRNPRQSCSPCFHCMAWCSMGAPSHHLSSVHSCLWALDPFHGEFSGLCITQPHRGWQAAASVRFSLSGTPGDSELMAAQALVWKNPLSPHESCGRYFLVPNM